MKVFSRDEKVEWLKRAPLFAGLSRKQLVQLARLSDDVEVPGRRGPLRGRRRATGVLVLVEGKVEVAKNRRRVATLGAATSWERSRCSS